MELYINNIRVDLNESIPFPLTFHISDIRDIEKRKGSSSKTIKLPGTRVNESVFSTVFSLTTSSSDSVDTNAQLENFDPSIKAEARYYENGVLQFEGVAQLMDCSRVNGVWEFSMVLYSEQLDIFSLLKNYKLRELGWSEYNHTLTLTNQQNSWSGTIQKNAAPYNNYLGSDWLGEGYYYGLIDYGYARPAQDAFEVEHIPPQVFVKSVVDKMFSAIGVDYTSGFFNTQQFKRLLVAYEGGRLHVIDATISAANSVQTDHLNGGSGYFASFGTSFKLNAPSELWTPYLSISGGIDYNSNTATNIDPSSLIQSDIPFRFVTQSEGVYTLLYAGDHDVNLNLTYGSLVGTPSVNGKIRCLIYIIKNGVTYQTDLLWEAERSFTGATDSFTSSFTYSTDLSLDPSDDIQIKFAYQFWGVNVDADATSVRLDIDVAATSCELDLTLAQQQITAGSTINIRQFLPDMDCGTFFKGLVNMFNLYVRPDTDNPRKLKIDPLNTFYQGSDTAADWTHLVDHSKEFKVTPTVNFSTKEYNFNFIEDMDYWNNRYFEDVVEQYGAKTIESGSQFAQGSTDIKLPFSNKVLGNIPETDLIIPRNYQVKTTAEGINDITERRGKAFIVQIKKGAVGTMQTANWTHIDENDVASTETSYPYVGHLDDIDSPTFDLTFNIPNYVFYDLPAGVSYTTNNLYIYHEKFIKELLSKYGKMLTCYVNITPDIINTLDFSKLININGVVYRLQKIDNYQSSIKTSTKVELIRLIEGESMQTYTVSINPDIYEPPSLEYGRITEAGEQRIIESSIVENRILEVSLTSKVI